MSSRKNQRRWMCISDSHGDCQDEKAVAEMFRFYKYWKPEIRIHAGDAFDFRPLRKKASEQEMREGKSLDVSMGLDLLGRYRPTHFLRGNHDERLWDLLQSDDGQKREAAGATVKQIDDALKQAGCEKVYAYDKRKGICNIGKLRVVHGYAAGVGAGRLHADAFGSCLYGHVHRVESYTAPSSELRVARCVGCLCKLDLEYNRAQLQTLRQRQGWAYGTMAADGTYHAMQAERIGENNWSIPIEWDGRVSA